MKLGTILLDDHEIPADSAGQKFLFSTLNQVETSIFHGIKPWLLDFMYNV